MDADRPVWAGLDLGSNSFHLLIVGRDREGKPQPLLSLGEKIRLGEALDEQGLNAAAMQRGWACLQRFRQHLDGYRRVEARAVGTSALREAANADRFLVQAEAILGMPIDIITGEREAQLIHQGVASQHELIEPTLIIDIGGGSTELILADAQGLQACDSVSVGCVTWLRYFPEGQLSAAGFEQAYHAALAQFQPLTVRYGGLARGIGCSGTLQALAAVCAQEFQGGLDAVTLPVLKQHLLRNRSIRAVNFQGLTEARQRVFASGLAIVLALFQALQLQTITISGAALREGLVVELLSRHG